MSNRHVSWPNLRKIIDAGAPARLVVPGQPKIELMIDAGSSALSLLIPSIAAGTLPSSDLEAIRIDRVLIDGTEYVRIITRERPLFQDFYLLLTELADSVQLDQKKLNEAFQNRIDGWKELLQSISLLSVEQQLGLLGELWVLGRLVSGQGSTALDSWTGPLSEPHDFRFTGNELEVKATRSLERTHIINGLEQLVPSVGQELFILSLQFEPAKTDDASSLPQLVNSIRDKLRADGPRLRAFDQHLKEGCGYRASDEHHYLSKFRLRTKCALVHVDDACPRLTRELLRKSIGIESDQRLVDVRYTVNLDGLGVLDGSPEFLSILPSSSAILPKP